MEGAKRLVAFVALCNSGGLVADAMVPSTARQHLWNPAWPPHAKFHNGQTMLMGVFGGVLSWPSCSASGRSRCDCRGRGGYLVAMSLTQAFPGTA